MDNDIRAPMNCGSKVNVMSLYYIQKLALKVQKISVKAKKIDGSTLEIFEMVIADFQIEDKNLRPRFFY